MMKSTKPPTAKSGANRESRLSVSSVAESEGDINLVSLKIGDRVVVSGTKPGVIAYIGTTKFATGNWVGVELDSPVGKNDGSVAGVRYFSCKPQHGVFSKAEKVTKLASTGNQLVSSPTEANMNSAAGDDKSYALLSVESTKQDVLPLDVQDSLTSTPAASSKMELPLTDIINSPSSESAVMPPPLSDCQTSLVKSEKTSNSEHTNTDHGNCDSVVKKSVVAKGSRLIPRSMHGSTMSLSRGSVAGSTTNVNIAAAETPVKQALKVGDRVSLGGSKIGTLRYVGTTEFQKGHWAGVELDEPLGKNDGSVDGKSLRRGSGSVSRIPIGPTLALARERSGSQESLSSLGSMTSSASRTRLRLGVTSLSSGQAAKSRHNASGDSSLTTGAASALQKALKEKEEHIEQLLLERDLDRSEVAKTAIRVEETESRLAVVTAQYNRLLMEGEETVKRMKAEIDKLVTENNSLINQLEEERKKVDDLQFAVEETSIDKGDLETRTEKDARQIRELEDRLKQELSSVQKANDELAQLRTLREEDAKRIHELEGLANQYSRHVEDLRVKLSDESDRSAFLESERACHLEVQQQEFKEEIEEHKSKFVSQIEDLNGKLKEANLRIEQLETEQNHRKAIEVEMTCILEKDKMQIMELENRIKELTSDVEQREHAWLQDMQHLKSKICDLEETNKGLSADVEQSNQTKARIVELERQLTVALNREAEYNDEVATAKRKEQQLTEMELSNQHIKNEMDKLNHRMTATDEALQLEKTRNLEHQQTIENLHNEIESLKAANLKEMNIELSVQLAKMETLEIEHNKILENERLRCAENAEEVKKLENVNTELMETVSESKEKVNQMQMKVQQLEALIENSNTETSSFAAAQHELITSLEVERDKVAQLEQKVKTLQGFEQTSSDLTQQMDSQRSKLANYEEKIVELDERLKMADSECVKLKVSEQELLAALELQTKRADDLNVLNDNLKSDMETCKNVEIGLSEMVDQYKFKIEELDNLNKEFTSDIDRLKVELTELQDVKDSEVRSLEVANRNLLAQVEELKLAEQDLVKLQKSECCKLEEMERINAELIVKIEAVKNSETEHLKAIEAKQVNLGQIELQKQQLGEQVELLQCSVEQEKTKSMQLENVCVELREKIRTTEADNLNLMKDLEMKTSEINSLNENLTSKLQQCAVKENELNLTIKGESKRIEDLKMQNEALELELKQAKQSVETLKESVALHVGESCEKDSANKDLKNEIERLAAELSNTKGQNLSEIAQLQAVNKELLERLEQMKSAEREITKSVHLDRTRCEELEQVVNELNTKLDALKGSENDQVKIIEAEQVKITELEKLNRNLSQNLASVQVTCDEQRLKMAEMERANIELTESNKRIDAIRTTLEKEYSLKIEKLEQFQQDLNTALESTRSSEAGLKMAVNTESAKCEQLTETNENLLVDLEKLKADINEQLQIIEVERAIVEKMKLKEQDLVNQLEQLNSELNARKCEFSAKLDENEKLKSNLEETLEVLSSDHSKLIENHTARILELELQNQQVTKQIEESNLTETEMKKQLETARMKYNEECQNRNAIGNELDQLKSEYFEQKLAVETLNADCSKFKQINCELSAEIERLKVDDQELSVHQSRISELEQQNNLLSCRIDELSLELSQTVQQKQQVLADFDNQIHDLHEEISRNSSVNVELRKTLEAQQNNNRDLEQLNNELSSKFEEANAANMEQQKMIECERAKNEELEKYNVLLKEEQKQFKDSSTREVAVLSEQLNMQAARVEQSNEQSKSECERLKAELLQRQDIADDLNAKVVEMSQTIERLTCSLNDANKSKADILAAQNAEHIQALELANSQINETEERNRELTEQCNRLSIVEQELNRVVKLEQSKTIDLEKVATELQESEAARVALEREMNLQKCRIAALDDQIEKLAANSSQNNLIEDEKNELAAQLVELEKRAAHTSNELISVKKLMASAAETSHLELQQRNACIDQLRADLEHLKKDNARLSVDNNRSIEILQRENSSLKSKVTLYENQRHDANANGVTEDGESFQAQIDFLNSVIVDLQRKNDCLHAKLEAMESGQINESSADISDASLAHAVAPRLFCDICDVFDLHDTDDCPRQAMSSDSPPASHYHGDRNAVRPYCDNCEVFGHSTSDCEDEQTY